MRSCYCSLIIVVMGVVLRAEDLPAPEEPTLTVVEITTWEGAKTIEALLDADLKARQTQIQVDYEAAQKAWTTAAQDFAKDPANRGKAYDVPPPMRPAVRTVRSKLSQADATKLVEEMQTKERERKQNTFYVCLLGNYRHQSGQHIPFITFVIPDGKNAWSETVQSKMRGKVDMKIATYEGTGNIFIQEDGQYTFDTKWGGDGCGIKIDGIDMGVGDRKPTKVELKKGLHKLSFVSALNYAPSVQIRDARNTVVPIFNSLAEIDEFTGAQIDSKRPLEVSGWKPTIDRQIKIPKQ